jgi:uncharacterized membrane protein
MNRPTDLELEASIARMLMIGIILAAVVVAAGGFLLLHNPGASLPDYTHFHAASPSLRTIKGAWHGAIHRDAQSIIQLGLMLLIATPVARVAFCVFGFSMQRDKLYTAISATVLAILIYSLTSGGR